MFDSSGLRVSPALLRWPAEPWGILAVSGGIASRDNVAESSPVPNAVEAHLEPVLGQVEMDCRRHLSSLSVSELDTAETGAKIGIEFTTLPF